jgi:GNAT superfamily N-acetyltransferase
MMPVAIRKACPSDIGEILLILSEVACRIPVDLSTPRHVEAMVTQINDRYFGDFSLVALGEDGQIVGFQLARKGRRIKQQIVDSSDAYESYIELAYAGVTAAAQGKGIFRRLIETEKKHALALVAEVKPGNKSDVGATLTRYGFENDPDGVTFHWRPE